MGMYGDLLNKLDDSLYVKIQPGPPVRLRLLDHPWISQQQFTDPSTGETNISTRFHWPVWDYAQQRVRILSQGKSVFEPIAAAAETWPQGDMMPSPFDVIIKRTGTGKNDTEYTVSTIPYGGTMPNLPSNELPDMEKHSKGIPVQQVMTGKRPPLIAAGGAAALPAPKNPTHVEAEAIEAAQRDHVVSDEEIEAATGPDGKINLDDIPF